MSSGKSTPNIIIIVLDTLRKDYSHGLATLQKVGFERFDRAVAPSSWTLPSHVSIFTGLLPSEHGVHEGGGVHIRNIRKLSIESIKNSNSNLLRFLHERGFRSYCFTSNPLVSPFFGFEFDDCHIYDAHGDSAETFNYLWNDRGRIANALEMVRNLKFGLLARLFYADQIQKRAFQLIGKGPLEKGSRYILKALREAHFEEPFFLFVNLMEAHPPYSWNERPSRAIQFDSLMGKKDLPESSWSQKYERHSNLAISRLFEILRVLQSALGNSLTVVTSDHGQLLGEHGRFDHGLFLDDELLDVPLYINVPDSAKPIVRQGPVINLIEIPHLVESVLNADDVGLGSTIAISESYGPCWDLSNLATNDSERSRLTKAYAHRVRIFQEFGSGTFNITTGTIEETSGEFDSTVVASLNLRETRKSHVESDVLTGEEGVELMRRLRSLGYD